MVTSETKESPGASHSGQGGTGKQENVKSATSYHDIDIDWISNDSIALRLRGEIIFVYNMN